MISKRDCLSFICIFQALSNMRLEINIAVVTMIFIVYVIAKCVCQCVFILFNMTEGNDAKLL